LHTEPAPGAAGVVDQFNFSSARFDDHATFFVGPAGAPDFC
jgi:hypothetical protein